MIKIFWYNTNMETTIFINIGLLLGIAIGVAFLVQLLRQPMIISYIITGIICGPLFLNLINSSQEFFDVFAQFGVILLLFLVGLSLNFNYLRKIGKIAAIAGMGQVVFTSFIGFFILISLGFTKQAAVFLAISITFSSTIIIMKLLSDKGEVRTTYGRNTIGLMLIQDIIAITIMILLPSLKDGGAMALSMALLTIKLTLFVLVVFILSKIVLPLLMQKIARSGEFLLIFTLGWCFALAGLGEWLGISLEVGAIIAGLSLGSSIYQTEISSRIKPLRDFFIALFFIILGSELNIIDFQSSVLPSLILSAFVLLGNPLILYLLYRSMKFTRKNSFMAGLTAAQVSEFGFIFLFVSWQMGYINADIISIFTIVALITIFVSSYLITYNAQIYKKFKPFFKLFGKDKHSSFEENGEQYDVLVFGYHRLGWKICESLKEIGVSFAVVDFNPMAIKKLEQRDIPHYFGDLTEVDFLNALPLKQTKMIISTLPNADDQITLIKHVRYTNTETLIIANLSHTKFLDDMYSAGADYIMIPHLVSGEWMGRILKNNSWNRKTFKDLTAKQREEMKLRFTLGEDKE